MHNDQMPKTVKRWLDKNKEAIEEFYIEADGWGYSDGLEEFSIWCHFKKGTFHRADGAHVIHEPTAKDFLIAARRLHPCDTDCDCQEEGW